MAQEYLKMATNVYKSSKKIDFINAPRLIYNEVEKIKEQLALDKIIVIRDAEGRISLFLTPHKEDFDHVEIETFIQEKLSEESTRISIISNDRVTLNDFLDEIYIQHEKDLDFFGDFILKNYEKYKEKREPAWLIERHLQYTSWFDEDQMEDMKPDLDAKVITGYSYKGGIGRTTLVALLALKAALEGKRVVAIDFDLEAPGLLPKFFNKKRVMERKGIVDYLVEKPILKEKLDIDQYNIRLNKPEIKGELRVFPAGLIESENLLNQNYIQKITRVNFNTFIRSKENTLTQLLKEIDSRYKPDLIFIDSRTGITEIGGLGTKGYSDIILMLFGEDDQNNQGMQIILPLIYGRNIIAINSQLRVRPDDGLDEEVLERFKINLFNTVSCLEEGIVDIADLEDYMGIEKMEYHPDLVFADETKTKLFDIVKNNTYSSVNLIYQQIKERLSNTEIEEKDESDLRETFSTKSVILNNIENLKVDAAKVFQTEGDFTNRFLFREEFKFLFQDDIFFITGDKGEGKTALFSLMNHKDTIIDFRKYLISKNIIKPENDWNFDSVSLEKGFGKPDSEDIQPPQEFFQEMYKEYKTNYEKYVLMWEFILLYQLEKVMYNQEYITEVKFKRISDVYKYLTEEYTMEIVFEVRDRMKVLNTILLDRGKKIYFIYDELDKEITEQRSMRGPIITGLLSMWYKYATLYDNVRSKIFLRNDIFRNEVEMTNKGHLEDYRMILSWEYKDVLKVMFKYLISNFKECRVLLDGVLDTKYEEKLGYFITDNEAELEKAVNTIFGTRMSSGDKAGKVFLWIRKRLSDANNKITPRRIVNLLIIAAEKEFKKVNPNSERLISAKSFEEALTDRDRGVSKLAVEELFEENKEYKPYLSLLADKIDRSVPIDENNLLSAFDQISNELSSDEKISSRTLLKELIEIGVLKEYQRGKKDQSRYSVPEIYLHGLNLTRKGRI